ncbi:MAG: RNA-guided pseudouridylation complex pseudouridine synthase subunit Cbf5 [Candidatus Heimdallarchaeota archaeon]|nr:MAG: RNA-guided pseudouridylation complex pseudouridine synthase subunit Cbf5 [Candidatus Heimdallarchaeota archaeon]
MVQSFPKIYDKVPNYTTNPNFGKPPIKRTVAELLDLGIINLDKPANPTSHEVTAWVKRIVGIEKAGHGGTLDPAVTGCLPIALGRATRALRVLLLAGKEYVFIMKSHSPVSHEKILEVLNNFQGKIYQTPPVRSSIKRRLRVRKIYSIELQEHDNSQLSLLRVSCEAGTYIRKLSHDIGLLLGTGAHMQELRRTRTGPFSEDSCITLQDLHDAWYYYETEGNETYIRDIIQPIEIICQHLPKLYIRDSAVDAICHGAALTLPGVLRVTDGINENSPVAILTMKEELVAFGRSLISTKEILELENGICTRPDTVFMEKRVYPSLWKVSKHKSKELR